MARDFAGSPDIAKATITAPGFPLSMAILLNSDSAAGLQFALSVGDEGSADSFHGIRVNGTSLQAVSREPGQGASSATLSSVVSAGVWVHATAVFASATSRIIYASGSSASASASRTPSGVDTAGLGANVSGTDFQFFAGLLAEAALWDVGLTQDEAEMMQAGLSPLGVRPGSLLNHWPLIGRTSPEIDIVGGDDLTVTGATVADHPGVFRPNSMSVGVPVAVVGGTALPMAMHHFRMRR